MYKVCERTSDEEGSDVYQCIDLGNRVQLENVGMFYYLGDMLNGGVGILRKECH